MEIESLQIHLNSKTADKYYNNSYSDCEFYFPVIEIMSQHHIYLSLKNIIIPYSFYNIDAYNNLLVYTVNDITSSVIIDYGNYNSIQLCAFLNTYMENFKVTYSTITNKLTFTNSLYNFTLDSDSTCFSLIGFSTEEPLYLQSILKSLTSEYSINLQSKQCICIETNFNVGNFTSSRKTSNNILCSIPITSAPNSNIVFINNSNFKSNLYTNIINGIKIRLLDQDHNLISLNGLHWSGMIQLDVVKFVD